MSEPQVNPSTSIYDGGGYDLNELKIAEESFQENSEKTTAEFIEVEPLYIPIHVNAKVARTEEYEARIVVIEYDEQERIIGVELL